jgi:formylmethanofuran dehydrogenase subunit E
MNKIEFIPIGTVVNEFNQSTDPHQLKSKPSRLVISPMYAEALHNIVGCEYLDVVFYFHQLEGKEVTLKGKTYSGLERGVFASRSPIRPNLIGVTTVRLLDINGLELLVTGLDALNGTPVLDIKCCDTSLFAGEAEEDSIHQSLLKTDPRMEVKNNIANVRTDILLIKAGQLHGHLCPGLAMGVMAAIYAIEHLHLDVSQMDELSVIAEVRNCLTDAIQFVTGCSFGKESFIYKDTGHVAFTFFGKEGKGIRLLSREKSGEVIDQSFSEQTIIDKAFGTLRLPIEQLFEISEVETVLEIS